LFKKTDDLVRKEKNKKDKLIKLDQTQGNEEANIMRGSTNLHERMLVSSSAKGDSLFLTASKEESKEIGVNEIFLKCPEYF